MIEFENVAATTEPFVLPVGAYTLAITGVFNDALVTLERRVPTHDGRVIFDKVTPPFSKPGAVEFEVKPNSAGQFRLRVDASGKPPKLSLLIAP
jgi:hypothetical protein